MLTIVIGFIYALIGLFVVWARWVDMADQRVMMPARRFILWGVLTALAAPYFIYKAVWYLLWRSIQSGARRLIANEMLQSD